MEFYWILIITIMALVIFIVSFFFFFSRHIRKSRFEIRSDGNPELKYFTAEDFENLSAESVEFPSDCGQILRGFIYRDKNCISPKGLIIWVHGFGAGHNAYTTEINTLAKAGYLVLGYDNTGCVLSDGNSMRGLAQGAIDVAYAVRFVANDDRLMEYKRFLVGHSWGGYSAMNIFSFDEKIDGVVAMCGFENAAGVVTDMSRRYFGLFAHLIGFFIKLNLRKRFGKVADLNSSTSLRKSNVPVLLLYGEQDGVVPFSTNGKKIIERTVACKNIRSIRYPLKGHSVYLTSDAERYTKEVLAKTSLTQLQKLSAAQRKEFFASIDYDLITREDESVMRTIIEFLDKIL